MAEDERTKKLNEFKIKKRDYTGYDDEEFKPGNAGVKRSVLSKYDEDIEGPRETVCVDFLFQPRVILTFLQGFRLGSSASVSKPAAQSQIQESTVSVNKSLLSIDYDSAPECFRLDLTTHRFAVENLETTDYLKEGDVGFKKPKVRLERVSNFRKIAHPLSSLDKEKAAPRSTCAAPTRCCRW